MRILQVHNRHRSRGGADHVLDHESELLERAGHVTERYLHPSARELGGSAISQGVKAVWNRAALGEISELIRRFEPDVMHVHTPFPLLSPAVFSCAGRHRVPAITTAHSFRYSCVKGTCLRDGSICEACVGTTFKTAGIRHRCYHDSLAGSTALTLGLVGHRLLGTFSRHVQRFVTLTEFARRLLIADGMAPDRVVVKPNSIDDPGPAAGASTAVSNGDRSPYAAFLGRFVPEKGIRTLLSGWQQLDGELRLKIAGDGPLRPEVTEATRTNPAIECLGWLDEAEVNELVAGAAFVVVPSEWYEAGEPLVLLRALALGRPVLVCDLENICGTVTETECGETFRTGDPADLAAVVRKLVADPDRLTAMGERARTAYERKFTPERNLESLLEIYRSVLPRSA